MTVCALSHLSLELEATPESSKCSETGRLNAPRVFSSRGRKGICHVPHILLGHNLVMDSHHCSKALHTPPGRMTGAGVGAADGASGGPAVTSVYQLLAGVHCCPISTAPPPRHYDQRASSGHPKAQDQVLPVGAAAGQELLFKATCLEVAFSSAWPSWRHLPPRSLRGTLPLVEMPLQEAAGLPAVVGRALSPRPHSQLAALPVTQQAG